MAGRRPGMGHTQRGETEQRRKTPSTPHYLAASHRIVGGGGEMADLLGHIENNSIQSHTVLTLAFDEYE